MNAKTPSWVSSGHMDDAWAGVLADRRHEPESHAVLIKERRSGFREIRPQLREFPPADHVEDAREPKH